MQIVEVGLVKFLQPETFFCFIVIAKFKKYIIPLLKTSEGGTLHPSFDVYVRSCICSFFIL